MFMRPTTFERLGELAASARAAPACISGVRLFGGSEQPESPECTPACSMCSMMPPISTSSPSHDRVDVDLDRDVEEAIEQHRAVVRDAHRPLM